MVVLELLMSIYKRRIHALVYFSGRYRICGLQEEWLKNVLIAIGEEEFS